MAVDILLSEEVFICNAIRLRAEVLNAVDAALGNFFCVLPYSREKTKSGNSSSYAPAHVHLQFFFKVSSENCTGLWLGSRRAQRWVEVQMGLGINGPVVQSYRITESHRGETSVRISSRIGSLG